MAVILDNSNLNESYAGVTTPLTFTFARRIYTRVYRQFCLMMGVSEQVVQENDEFFQNMLASVAGRMYYNLSSWHQMMSLLPVYSLNGPFLEQMMGLDPENRGKIAVKPYGRLKATLNTVVTLLRIIGIFLTMPVWHWYFNRRFTKKYQRFQRHLQQETDLRMLLQQYQAAEESLTQDFRIPIANDFAVMISTGLIKKYHESQYGTLPAQFAFRAQSEVKSAEPGKFIWKLVEKIHSRKEYRQIFAARHSVKKIASLLTSYPELATDIEYYRQTYGYRVPGELKLESLTFMNDTHFILSFLQQQVRKFSSQHASAITSSEQPSAFQLPLYLKWLESWAESSITRREQTRFQRTLIFGLTRDAFLKVGKILASQKLLATDRDVFFLTVEELLSHEHEPTKTTLKEKVKQRKKQQKEFIELEIPSHLELKSYPVKNVAEYRRQKTPDSRKKASGRVASTAGLTAISGETLVLETFDSRADFHNKILVTKQTDPGWTIVFPFLRGIIVERGGLLSHAAIVAREFNVPCIMGVADATKRIPHKAQAQLNLEDGSITW